MELYDIRELKKYILEHYDQVSIFATYFQIDDKEIEYCLRNKSYAICNPDRNDRRASLGFMSIIDKETNLFKIKMHDWADPKYRGDCFILAGIFRHLNPFVSAEFIAICKDIIHTMKHKTLQHDSTSRTLQIKADTFTPIHIEVRLWNKSDIDRWNNWGLPFNEIQSYVFPLNNTFISNFHDYTYTEDDPGYAWITGYYENKTLYCLYFPNRDGKDKFKPRFRKNNKFYPIENIEELKPADVLVITKAFKEKHLIRRLIPKLITKLSIQVTNPTSESVILSKNFILKLYDIYATIITNMDFDLTGLSTSRQHKRNYGMMRFIPTNGRYNTYDFGGKDLCDIYRNKGEQYCIDLMQEVYDYIEYQIELETNSNLF